MKNLSRMLLVVLALGSTYSHADSEPFIGEIQFVGFNFAPRGWANCDGSLLPIAENTALFSVIGTTYGGDGRTTFALPDMRGRIPVHQGNGPGLNNRRLGEKSGTETNTLTEAQIPSHSHYLMTKSSSARKSDAEGRVIARTRSNLKAYESVSATNPADAALAPESISHTGNGLPVNNMHPYQTVRCIIALQGLYPSRN